LQPQLNYAKNETVHLAKLADFPDNNTDRTDTDKDTDKDTDTGMDKNTDTL
jgi:hypothetical protein